jgi:hypothetical protein
MFTYKSRFLTRAEVWYDDEPGDTRRLDWLLYHRRSHPVPGMKSKVIWTYAIDLKQSDEQLLANLNKDTAYKIRRARERDKIICESCDPQDAPVMSQFEQMYNIFAGLKNLAPLNRPRMESMAAAGVLDLTVAKDPQGNALVYHANYHDRRRATSMELPSLYRKMEDSTERNLISRANRYLTWSDILRYKQEGLEVFDFGGWYQGTDPAMLTINEFKRGFGGQVLCEYECGQILTFKGRLVLAVAAVLNRTKRISRKTHPDQNASELITANADAGQSIASPVIKAPVAHKSELVG